MNILIGCLYLINPLLSVPAISYDYRNKNSVRTSIWIALVMAYLAYYAQASIRGDIETYIGWLELYRDIPIWQCFDKVYTGLYVTDLFFWLMAKLPDERLMISVVAFILYFLNSYMVLEFFKNRGSNNNRGGHVLACVLMIMPFYYYISAIRSSIAITLAVFGVYLETLFNNRKTIAIVIYIITVFIHRAAMVIVLIRLGLVVFKKFKWAYGLFLGVAVGLLGTGNARLLANLGISGVLGEVLSKALEYSSIGNQLQDRWNVMVRNSVSAKVWLAYFFILSTMLLLLAIRRLKEIVDGSNIYFFFCVNLLMTIVGMMFFPNRIYLRYLSASIGFVAGFAHEVLFQNNDRYIKRYRMAVVYIFAFFGLVQQLYNMFLTVDPAFFLKHILLGLLNLVII